MPLSMDLTWEQENFIKLARVIIEIIPKHLRALFITKWNAKVPNQPWKNDATSGQYLYNAMLWSVKDRKEKFNDTLHQMILAGNCESWDPSILFCVLLYARFYITETYQPHSQRASIVITERIHIHHLSDLRSKFFGYIVNMSVPNVYFEVISRKIRRLARDSFGTIAEDEIKQIIDSQSVAHLSYEFKSKLAKERQINEDFMEWVAGLKGRLLEGTQDVAMFFCSI